MCVGGGRGLEIICFVNDPIHQSEHNVPRWASRVYIYIDCPESCPDSRAKVAVCPSFQTCGVLESMIETKNTGINSTGTLQIT